MADVKIIELGKLKAHRHSSLANSVVSTEGISPTLDTMQGGGREPKIAMKSEEDANLVQYNEPLTKSDVKYDFTFVETFAGIGGVSFGFEAVGGRCVLAAEYDPTAENPDGTSKRQFAQDAYKALHPETPVVGDVFKLDAKDVPDCDVLSFTTPCQSFSVAGKRLGFEDTRGTLVFEALRIAKEKRPKALFMENVKGLVNHDKGRTIDTILHAMNEVGYTVDFNVLNSKFFHVPQNRERVFIIALRDDLIEPTEWQPEGNTMLPKAKRRLKEAGLRTFNFNWPEQGEVTKRLRDVLEAQVDEKYYLSEEKTTALVAELEAKETVLLDPSQRKREGKCREYDEVAPTVNARDYKEPRMVIEKTGGINVLGHIDIRGHRPCREVYGTDGISACLTTMGGGHREPKTAISENGSYRIRKLIPRECMRLQGFPESATDTLYAEGFSDSRIYKFAGNAVTTTVIKALGEKLISYLDDREAE